MCSNEICEIPLQRIRIASLLMDHRNLQIRSMLTSAFLHNVIPLRYTHWDFEILDTVYKVVKIKLKIRLALRVRPSVGTERLYFCGTHT